MVLPPAWGMGSWMRWIYVKFTRFLRLVIICVSRLIMTLLMRLFCKKLSLNEECQTKMGSLPNKCPFIAISLSIHLRKKKTKFIENHIKLFCQTSCLHSTGRNYYKWKKKKKMMENETWRDTPVERRHWSRLNRLN